MRARLVLASAAALACAGCGGRVVTPEQRQEAAVVVSEGRFAVELRDWKRAEGLYAKAAALCPDTGDIWFNLGVARMRLHDRDGARSAYRSALPAYRDAYERNSSDSNLVIHRAYVLVLLGKPDDARSVLEKARAQHPDDRRLRSFEENHALEGMIADPAAKEISP